MAAPPRVIVVEHALLNRLMVDPSYQADFGGCLGQLRASKPTPGCRKCGRSMTRDAADYNAAKLCLIGLPQALRDKLKQKLGATTLRLIVSQNGRTSPFDI